MSEKHSQDYVEARAILGGTSLMLPELRHLEALEEHYQSSIIKICYDMDTLTTEFRQRN